MANYLTKNCLTTLVVQCLFVHLICAQTITQQQQMWIDSLQSYSTSDTQYVWLLNDLAHTYWNKAPQQMDSIAAEALKLANRQHYPRGQSRSYHERAVGQWMLGDYPKAFEFATEQLRIAETHGFREMTIKAFAIMALIHDDQGQTADALRFHDKVLEARRADKDSASIGKTLNNMAAVYYRMDSLELALELFRQAYTVREAIQEKRGMRESLANQAFILNELDQSTEAMKIMRRALQLAIEMQDQNSIINYQGTIGSIHRTMNQPDSAEIFFNRALQLAEETGINKRIIEFRKELAELYQAEGDHYSAYRYLEKYWVLKDSIEGASSADRIRELQAQYESEKQGRAIIELEQQRNTDRIWRYLLLAGILLVAAAGFLLYRYQRYRTIHLEREFEMEQQLSKQLKELDRLKGEFFTNISHEFRTPLTVISGVADRMKEDSKEKDLLRRNSGQLLELINQILDLRKLESGTVEVNHVQGDIIQYLRYLTASFQGLLDQKGVAFHFWSETAILHMDYDPEKLNRIVTNLLSNATKFTSSGGQVTFEIQRIQSNNKAWVQFKVQDTGSGIEEEQLAHIFDRFYQAEQDPMHQETGTGIGLTLVRELVILLGGSISVDSRLAHGTTFTVSLPIHNKAPLATPGEQSQTSKVRPLQERQFAPTKLTVSSEPVDSDQLTALIIEDNPDVAHHVFKCLEDHYRVEIARDGQEGIDKALASIPDIVISDIMMPKKDGLEVCDTLKQDKRTSHIPVVLLTCKADVESRIAGLKRGADSYLPKPFRKEELLVQMDTLISLRKKLQERYRSPLNSALNPHEEEHFEDAFIQKFREVVETHLDDPDFNVGQLCREMALSRSHLHRKITALTGKSTAEFQRMIRLNRAAELLKGGELNVSQVAFEVGFRDPSYFSKAFTNEFQVTPSQFRTKRKVNADKTA